MQTVETLNEGLKRAYTLTISAKDIESRVESEVANIAPQIRMPGFRPGKVPANLIRKMHGERLQAEALNTSIQEGVQKVIADNKLRPAMQPAVELQDGFEFGKDAEVKMSLEVLPTIAAPSVEGLGIKLERLTVEVADEAVDEAANRIAEQQNAFAPHAASHKAKTGDIVVMDFAGKVDGVAFDGGTGEGMKIEIGSGGLIPGFEDQLIGLKTGDEAVISVTFPDDYGVDTLKGQPATFDIKVTALLDKAKPQVDEEFAKALGLEGLEQLRGLLKAQIEQEHGGLTRTHMKRKLLDQLASSHDFDVPPSMVEAEFAQIWGQLEHEAGHEENPDQALAELEKDKEDYRGIAVRRVRLGLLLSEIGQANGIEVNQREMQMLVQQAAQQYRPQDRERFVQYIQNEPMAAAQLRAPLYEDKVVDFLFEKAEITERTVTKEELEAAIEAEDGAEGHVHGPDCGHDHDHDHKPAKKTAAKKAAPAEAEAEAKPAKKAAAKKADATEGEAEAKPAKKAPAKKAAKAEAE